ncbi:hypothetical protein FGA82_20540 [Pseudomonas fluorescens]|nr:hypothetical protein FGA82_20540 [Pseudomonas fluorescens]
MCRWGIRGRFRCRALWSSRARSKAPHPNPLPEGEGTDWGILENCADVIDLYRIHNRLGHSGRCTTPDTSVGPLSLWAVRRFGRAGVREEGLNAKTPADTPPASRPKPA